MAHDEADVRQAEQLDRVVGNIIGGGRDLFQGTEAKDVLPETMELIDLATFIIPPEDSPSSEYKQRMHALVLRESHQHLSPTADSSQQTPPTAWSLLMKPFLRIGSAAAAFFAALFMEPMPGSRSAGSIDTPSRQWYNYQMGRYAVSSARSDVGQAWRFGFSDGGPGYRAAVCR